MSNDLTAPCDLWAEREVAGCAIATQDGARLAAGRLVPADFYHPGLQRMFAAALELGDVANHNTRIAAVAVMADVTIAEVRELVEARAAMWDRTGKFAARVADAARRRQLMQQAADVFNALGHGATLDEIQPHLAQLRVTA